MFPVIHQKKVFTMPYLGQRNSWEVVVESMPGLLKVTKFQQVANPLRHILQRAIYLIRLPRLQKDHQQPDGPGHPHKSGLPRLLQIADGLLEWSGADVEELSAVQ